MQKEPSRQSLILSLQFLLITFFYVVVVIKLNHRAITQQEGTLAMMPE
jgi:hypothetical protein